VAPANIQRQDEQAVRDAGMTILEAIPLHANRSVKNALDAEMRELHRFVESGQFTLLSLDVFDTLVWRMVPRPTDVFFLVARELIQRDMIYPSATPESFVRERVNAEHRAREAAPSREVTLDAIYAMFPIGYLRGVNPRELVEVELATERDVVRVDTRMRALIDLAKARGMQTAVVSDTYFTRPQIRELVDVEVDHTILSCERNVSKYMGLHRFLLIESRVSPDRILHVGDNLHADVEGPRAFGIQHYWLRKWPEPLATVVQEELPDAYSARAPYLSTHDGGLTSLRSRATNSCESDYAQWGAGVLGPIVTGFAGWVSDRCRALEITDVLCLMREGRLLSRVVEREEAGLRCHEFFISRFVALKAAIFEGGEEELQAFARRPAASTRGAILEQLGLRRDAIKGADPEQMLSSRGILELASIIANDRNLRKEVVRSSAETRKRLLRHLANLVPIERKGRVAVVDLGYSGTIQRCLHAVCAHEEVPIALHGLYLVTGGDVHETQATGVAAEGWLAENGQPTAIAHTFMRSPEFIEQSMMADCGSTIGYAEDGSPVLQAVGIPDEQRRQISEVQQGVLQYAKRWRDHRQDGHWIDPNQLRLFCQAICVRTVARPLQIELQLFGAWVHDANFGTEAVRTLTEITGLHPWQTDHMSAHQLASLPSSQVHWPFGVAWAIGPTMGEAIANIYLRTVKPEVFDSAHGIRELTFYWDSGHGFRPAQSSVERYAANNRGRVWHRSRLEIRNGRNRRFGFGVGLPGEMIQLMGVVLHIYPHDGEATVVAMPHDEIEKVGYTHLRDHVYVVEQDPAFLVVQTDQLDGFNGVVDVDICFSPVMAV
jgi:FMN phosphatase YigB (HAD superfamily)